MQIKTCSKPDVDYSCICMDLQSLQNWSIITYKLKYKIEGSVHQFDQCDEKIFAIGQGRGAGERSTFYSPHPFASALHLHPETHPHIIRTGKTGCGQVEIWMDTYKNEWTFQNQRYCQLCLNSECKCHMCVFSPFQVIRHI